MFYNIYISLILSNLANELMYINTVLQLEKPKYQKNLSHFSDYMFTWNLSQS